MTETETNATISASSADTGCNSSNSNNTSNSSGSDGWIEIRGHDLLYKVIESKKALGAKDDDEPQQVKIGDTVLIDLKGRQSNDIHHTNGPIFQQAKGWLVGVGDLDVLTRAVEYALPKLYAGQTAYIWSSAKYNLGEGTRKYKVKSEKTAAADEYNTLPPNASVMYEVKVIQIVVDTSRLNPYFPIQKALTRKNIANDIYQYEWESGGTARERALRLYEKAAKDMAKLLDGTYFHNQDADHPQRKQCRQILLDCHNNIIAVYMRAQRYSKAREAVNSVLKHDPNNVKALFRNAKIAMMDPSTSLQEADEALKRAENVIVYKDAEEVELRKLRAQWKKRKDNPQAAGQ